MPRTVDTRRGTRAVVHDLELEFGRAVADDHFRPRLPRMLERVRERLLHDPVGGHVDAWREMHRFAFESQFNRQPSLAHLLDQRLERAEPRLRPDRELLVTGA